jgi:polyhydroxyalkanoate synthesis regulator phasin
LNTSFDELLENPSPNSKLKRQFKDIISSLSFADRAQIGFNINEIQELRKRLDSLQSKIDEMKQ